MVDPAKSNSPDEHDRQPETDDQIAEIPILAHRYKHTAGTFDHQAGVPRRQLRVTIHDDVLIDPLTFGGSGGQRSQRQRKAIGRNTIKRIIHLSSRHQPGRIALVRHSGGYAGFDRLHHPDRTAQPHKPPSQRGRHKRLSHSRIRSRDTYSVTHSLFFSLPQVNHTGSSRELDDAVSQQDAYNDFQPGRRKDDD